MNKMLKFLAPIFALALWLSPSRATFEEGYSYDYFFKAETEIMGMDNMTTEIDLTLTKVLSPETQGLIRLSLSGVTQYSALAPDQKVTPDANLQLPFYFTVGESGTVGNIYSDPDENEDITVLKKSIAGTISHFRQVPPGEDHWDYSVEEHDHMGDNLHHYTGVRQGSDIILSRTHFSDDKLHRTHGRVIKLDSESRELRSVDDSEEVLVSDNPPMVTKHTEDNPHDVHSNEMRLRTSAMLRFQDKHKLRIVPTVSSESMGSMEMTRLNMMKMAWRDNRPGEQDLPRVEELLECTKQYDIKDRRHIDCASEMMQLLHHMNQMDMVRWAHNFIIRQCQGQDQECVGVKSMVISALGQMNSPEAQTELINHVLRNEEALEEDVSTVIFALGATEDPIPDACQALQELCFGQNFEHHGKHGLGDNQRRACLALGSIMRIHKDRQQIKEVINHFHSWLETDIHRVSELLDTGYHDLKENIERSDFITTKHVLIEAIANAAQPESKKIFMKYAAPNFGHTGWRHGALTGLSHFHDEESATAILNSTLNDDMYNVRVLALDHYKKHPKAFNLNQDDEAVLARHEVNAGSYKRSKRSLDAKICNLIERLTLDKEWRLPGVDWQKDVGIDMFGANFGIKIVNRMHLHVSPVKAFFEVEAVESAWIRAWMRMVVRWKNDLLRAELCYHGSIRFFDMNFLKDWTQEHFTELRDAFDPLFQKHATALNDSINQFNAILADHDIPELGLFDLDTSSPMAFVRSIDEGVQRAKDKDWQDYGKSVAIAQLEKMGFSREEIKSKIEDYIEEELGVSVDIGQIWGMIVKEGGLKEAAKEEIKDRIDDKYKNAQAELMKVVRELNNPARGLIGREISFASIDKVMEEWNVSRIVGDSEGYINSIIGAAQDAPWAKDREKGMLGMIQQMVNATRVFSADDGILQSMRNNIREFKKSDLLDIEHIDWMDDVKKVVQAVDGLVDDDQGSVRGFFHSISDSNTVTYPYISFLTTYGVDFMKQSAQTLQEYPTQGMKNIKRASRHIKGALAGFIDLHEKLIETQGDVTGTLAATFMDLGTDLENVKKGIDRTIRKMSSILSDALPRMTQNGKEIKDSALSRMGHEAEKRNEINDRGRAIAERVHKKATEEEMAKKTLEFMEKLRDDVFDIQYLSDAYMDGVYRTIDTLPKLKDSFEQLDKRVQETNRFINEVFGVLYHPAFPDQIRDCDNCACGVFPQHIDGRAGNLFKVPNNGHTIVNPLDGFVKKSPERPDNEIIVRPVDTDMEDFELIIRFVNPDAMLDFSDASDEEKELLNEYGILLEAGVPIGTASGSPCGDTFIFVSERRKEDREEEPPPSDEPCDSNKGDDGYYYADSRSHVGTPFPMPKWVTHCQHTKFKMIGKRTADLKNFAERFRDFTTKLTRNIMDFRIPPIKIPSFKFSPNLDTAISNAFKLNTNFNKMVKSFPTRIGRFVNMKPFKKSYEWVNGIKVPQIKWPNYDLDKPMWSQGLFKFPELPDFIDLNKMSVKDLEAWLRLPEINLIDYANKLNLFSVDLWDSFKQKVWDNPFKWSPSQLRGIWEHAGFPSFNFPSLDDISLKSFEISDLGWIVGEGSICDFKNKQLQVLCTLKTNFASFVKRLDFRVEHDECARILTIYVNDHVYQLHYDEDGASIEEVVDIDVKTVKGVQVKGTATIKADVRTLFDPENKVILTATITPCVTEPIAQCSPPIEVTRDFEMELRLESGDDCVNRQPEPDEGQITLEQIKDMSMEDFTQVVDKVNGGDGEIFKILDGIRTGALEAMQGNTNIKDSIDGNEFHNRNDVEAIDKKTKLFEKQMVFFKVPFVFPLVPLIFKVEIGASGVFGLNFWTHVKIMESETSVTLDPWIAAAAFGSGSAAVVGFGGGCKVTGYLLETHFPFTIMFQYEEYPIKITQKLDVELIPLRCKFEGFVKMLFVKIYFTIWEWQADKYSWNIFTKHRYIEDKTPPYFTGDKPPGVPASYQGKCHVEQLQGRHPSDAAFLLEAPFNDDETQIHTSFCVGTYHGGCNAIGWTEMEGPSIVSNQRPSITGVPLHWTVKARNQQGLETFVHCSLGTYDVTAPYGRIEPSYTITSHHEHIGASLVIHDDSPLLKEQRTAVGWGEGYYGNAIIDWHPLELTENGENEDAPAGENLRYFASGRQGKLTTKPLKVMIEPVLDYCARECVKYPGDRCISFDYDSNTKQCELQPAIEGPGVLLRQSSNFLNFERLDAGYSAYISPENMELEHGRVYHINAHIMDNMAYESYIPSEPGTLVDHTPPEPGPIGDAVKDDMYHANCDVTINHHVRCEGTVTQVNNSRMIIDGDGATTLLNGPTPREEEYYAQATHYLAANWHGFHDDETGLYMYLWGIGRQPCKDDFVAFHDPHGFIVSRDSWTNVGYAMDLDLKHNEKFYSTLQVLNNVVHGGALVTTVCHSVPIITDYTRPDLDDIEDTYWDEFFDILGIYFRAKDDESGIKRVDFGVGETPHDALILPYAIHGPEKDGYQMVSFDDANLPEGVPLWLRVRPMNNVNLYHAGHSQKAIILDRTGPLIGVIWDGNKQLADTVYWPNSSFACAQWLNWHDPESGIGGYEWAIGSNNTNADEWFFFDVQNFTAQSAYSNRRCTEQTLHLQHNTKYYNFIRARNKATNVRWTRSVSDGFLVDLTDPVAGYVYDGSDIGKDLEYTYNQATLEGYWGDFYDPESGIEKYEGIVHVNHKEIRKFDIRKDKTFIRDHSFHFKHNDWVELTIKAVDGATRTNETKSSGYLVDITQPEVNQLIDEPNGRKYISQNTTLYVKFQFTDPESGVHNYSLMFYHHYGGKRYEEWVEPIQIDPRTLENRTYENTFNHNLRNGLRYTAEVIALNGAGLESKHQSHGVKVDMTPPVIQRVNIGFFGADEFRNAKGQVVWEEDDRIFASWLLSDPESGIEKTFVAVGTSPNAADVSNGFRDFGSLKDGYIDGLELVNDTIYYVTVYAENGAGLKCENKSSNPILKVGQDVPGEVFDGRLIDEDEDYQRDTTSVAMSFSGFESPACGIRDYEWAVGSEPGYSDVLPFSSIGIVWKGPGKGRAQAHLHLEHGQTLYVTVRALTGFGQMCDRIIYSGSDGITVDTEKPDLVLTSLGLFGLNDARELKQINSDAEDQPIAAPLKPLYQVQYDSIEMEWNVSDTSQIKEMTWMAGRMPLDDGIHPMTLTTDNQIPLKAVDNLKPGETVVFTVIATDSVNNQAILYTPALTIETTPPNITDFRCNKYVSRLRQELKCQWESTIDVDSPVQDVVIGVGTDQSLDDIVEWHELTKLERTWSIMLHDKIFDMDNETMVVSLRVNNTLHQEETEVFYVTVDETPPVVGHMAVITPSRPDGSDAVPKICQQSTGTVVLSWGGFEDPETDIESYEVAVGHFPGGTDVHQFETFGADKRRAVLTNLGLIPGSQYYVSVRAVNKAGLQSGSASSAVHISPSPRVTVQDGLGDFDQTITSELSISGKVTMTPYCPLSVGRWFVYNLAGELIEYENYDEDIDQNAFYNMHFESDELPLEDMKTYYVEVEIIDAINRTFRARSNGVTVFTEPPVPGLVRDGPEHGEDRDYQRSSEELSVNWEPFGDEEFPGHRIEYYEVAFIDDLNRRPYFKNVGKDVLSYTAYDLMLDIKNTTYYAIVRGHAESGAFSEAMSNGVRVGYRPGMISGEVELAPYLGDMSPITFSWDGFWTDFFVVKYHWGISSQPFEYSNITALCKEYLPDGNFTDFFDVIEMQDAKLDTFVSYHYPGFEHNTRYYVTVIAEDEPGQCIASKSESFLFDATPPVTGDILIKGQTGMVHYIVNTEEVEVTWEGFEDKESGIAEFVFQLFAANGPCDENGDYVYEPLAEVVDVQNISSVWLYDYDFEREIPYKIRMNVTNNALLMSSAWSDPFYVDNLPPHAGDVKDGIDWKESALFQAETDKIQAVIAFEPEGNTYECLTQEPIEMRNGTKVEDYEDPYTSVVYDPANLKWEACNTTMCFNMVLQSDGLEGDVTGGGFRAEPNVMHPGKFEFKVKAGKGDNVITSITVTDVEDEALLDAYFMFRMINYTDPMDDDDFDEQRESIEIDWDNPNATDTTYPPGPSSNITSGEVVNIFPCVFKTDGFGMHIVGHSFGRNNDTWFMLVWVRNDLEVIEEWIRLDEDPTESMHEYEIVAKEDLTTNDNIWNLDIIVDGEIKGDIEGVHLPETYRIKLTSWFHDRYRPDEAFVAESSIADMSIPKEQSEMCHYGEAFYDLDSGISKIYIGVSNDTSEGANVAPFTEVMSVCYPCISPCDKYKCNENCTIHKDAIEGYVLLNLELDGLDLYPGDYEHPVQPTPPDSLEEYEDFEDIRNITVYNATRYYVMVKAVDNAGLESIQTSPGIRIDNTGPISYGVTPVDPHFHSQFKADFQGQTDELEVWWDFEEIESFITHFMLSVGSQPGLDDIVARTNVGLDREWHGEGFELTPEQMVYYTVEAFNAVGLSTKAEGSIQVKLDIPDVSAASVQQQCTNGDVESICITESPDQLYMYVQGTFPDDTHTIMWSVGLTPNDDYILRPSAVDTTMAQPMEMKEGFLWYDGQKSEESFLAAGVRTEKDHLLTEHLNLTDPGWLNMEPGMCIYHHVNAMNDAHNEAEIPSKPVCYKRIGDEDETFASSRTFEFNYEFGTSSVKLSGTGKDGRLMSGKLAVTDMDIEYGTSANMSYIPSIVKPQQTLDKFSEGLRDFLAENGLSAKAMEESAYISPVPSATMTGPLSIELRYTPAEGEDSVERILVYWSQGQWHLLAESCGEIHGSNDDGQVVSGQFCGEAVEGTGDYRVHYTQFGLFTGQQVAPPSLVVREYQVPTLPAGQNKVTTSFDLEVSDPLDEDVYFIQGPQPERGQYSVVMNTGRVTYEHDIAEDADVSLVVRIQSKYSARVSDESFTVQVRQSAKVKKNIVGVQEKPKKEQKVEEAPNRIPDDQPNLPLDYISDIAVPENQHLSKPKHKPGHSSSHEDGKDKSKGSEEHGHGNKGKGHGEDKNGGASWLTVLTVIGAVVAVVVLIAAMGIIKQSRKLVSPIDNMTVPLEESFGKSAGYAGPCPDVPSAETMSKV